MGATAPQCIAQQYQMTDDSVSVICHLIYVLSSNVGPLGISCCILWILHNSYPGAGHCMQLDGLQI